MLAGYNSYCSVDLVIKNFGATAARDVETTIEPPLQSSINAEVDKVIVPRLIRTLVPGQQWSTRGYIVTHGVHSLAKALMEVRDLLKGWHATGANALHVLTYNGDEHDKRERERYDGSCANKVSSVSSRDRRQGTTMRRPSVRPRPLGPGGSREATTGIKPVFCSGRPGRIVRSTGCEPGAPRSFAQPAAPQPDVERDPRAPKRRRPSPLGDRAGSTVILMVELVGLEPTTFALPARRSPS